MTTGLRVLLISGSLRAGSTNTALLRTAEAVCPHGIVATLYGDLGELPHFDPDLDGDLLPPAIVALRDAIHDCDAILFCTPEYAGALPGSFKNLLDWTIGDAEPGSIYEKPVAWVNASAAPTGAADAHESLQKVLRYAHADVVKDACLPIPVLRQMIGDDGLIHDPAVRHEIQRALSALVAGSATAG
ncbi:MAG TPA: NADPH-dependent FMN reductase [Acidimicrobiales bacterium]|nr:NADPH-dependent FMN reductase [Acidimicrobiales bacterium]